MWLYNNKDITEDDIKGYVGFVYLIENLDNNMYYIGKKSLKKTKVYQKNKKKKRTLVESDWKDYTGSNDLLNEHIESGNKIRKTIMFKSLKMHNQCKLKLRQSQSLIKVFNDCDFQY